MTPKELAVQYTIGLWNDKNMSLIYKYLDKDVILYGPNMGNITGYKAMENALYTWVEAFPDIMDTIVHVICEGEYVSVHYKATGTHKGTFMGMRPTNKRITWEGIVIYRIKNEKIIEITSYNNMSKVTDQLGRK